MSTSSLDTTDSFFWGTTLGGGVKPYPQRHPSVGPHEEVLFAKGFFMVETDAMRRTEPPRRRHCCCDDDRSSRKSSGKQAKTAKAAHQQPERQKQQLPIITMVEELVSASL